MQLPQYKVMTNLRHMESRVAHAARDANLKIDPMLTSVTEDSDTGALTVLATISNFPNTHEEAELMRSALHAVLLDEFCNLVPELTVRVFVPPPLRAEPLRLDDFWSVTKQCQDTPPFAASGTVTDWIQSQVSGGNEYITNYFLTLVSSSYRRVIDAYPWRDRNAMQALVPKLVAETMTRLEAGVTDHASRGDVDAILPPLDAVLLPFDQSVVHAEITAMLGRQPSSLLHLYECVFALCQTHKGRAQTRQLYERLFFCG